MKKKFSGSVHFSHFQTVEKLFFPFILRKQYFIIPQPQEYK